MKITDVTLTLFYVGEHPVDDLRPPLGAADRQERSRPVAGRHRRGHRGPRLSRHLVEPGEPRRTRADPLSEAGRDGAGPARPRAAQQVAVGARPGRDGALDRRRRHRAVGHRRQEGRAADPPADRHQPRQDRRLCQLRDPHLARGLCRAGHALPIDRLARLQDPPAAAMARGHQGVRGGAGRRSATTTRSCSNSTWSYRYEEALRVGLAIQEMGYYWYEDPLHEQDIYNYVKLRQKLTSRSSPPNTRSAGSIHTSHGSPSAPPTYCAATSR